MTCKDPSITYLKSFGYNVVRLPKADISPLQVLTRKGASFESLGELSTVLSAGSQIGFPSIKSNIVTASISGQRTSDLSLSVGIDILGNIVGAMGGSKIGLQAQYSKARTIAFEFEDVLTDSVEIAALDQYLTDADTSLFSTYIKKLMDSGDFYIVTSVIKSSKISVSATANDKSSLNVDVPVLKDAVGGKVGIAGSTDNNSKVTFSGPTPLIFGFKAVKVSYKMGVYTAFDPVLAGDGALSGTDKWNWLTPEEVLLDLV